MPDINVNLYLATNDDIGRLQQAMQSFNTGVNRLAATGTEGGDSIGGAGSAKVGTSHGLPSQNKDLYTMSQMYAKGKILAGVPDFRSPEAQATIGTSRGLMSRVGSGIQTAYGELPGTGFIGKAGLALAFAPQAMHTFGALNGALGGALMGGGLTSQGTQLGLQNRNGILGMGLGSTAFTTGLQNSFGGMVGSVLNPSLPEASAIAQQGGYNPNISLTGNPRGYGGQVTSLLTAATRGGLMAPDTAKQWMESLRYGGTNIGQLSAAINNLSSAARAAHENTQAYAQGLTQAAEQYSQSTGAPSGFATSQFQGFSSATGLPASVLGNVASSSFYQTLAIGANGGNLVKTFMGRNAGMSEILAQESIIAPRLGYRNYAEIAAVMKGGDTKAQNRIWENLLAIQRWMPDLFVGVTPEQLLKMIVDSGGTRKMAAGIRAGNELQLAHAMGSSVGGARVAQAASDYARSIGKTVASLDLHGTNEQKINDLIRRQTKRSHNMTEGKGQFTLKLTGYAQKVFQLAATAYADQHPLDTSTPAVQAAVWRPSYK